MNLDAEFLSKLRCPRSHRPLRTMSDAELAALNAQISRGQVKTVGGRVVDRALEAGLVPEGESFAYPVDGGIPILLVDEAIPTGAS